MGRDSCRLWTKIACPMNTKEIRMASNRVSDIRRYCHAELDALYGSGEVESMVRMLFDAFLGWDTARLLLHLADTIDQSDLLRFHWAVEDLRRFRPIQHIIGYADFCGCRLAVSPDVLIPRPETEQLVEWAITECRSMEATPLRLLDLCTGSGCIAIALAKGLPNADVWAADLSPQALVIAQKNAQHNGVSIHCVEADVFSPQLHQALDSEPFDLIVSNPPYVMEHERATMARNVLDHEPAMALFVPDDDPLCFYCAIADFAMQALTPHGSLLMEINETLGSETIALMRQKGFRCELRQDFCSKDRIIRCQRMQSGL